ncbi:hypothetical protein [Burkholderia ambifaria]|uniref:hypothetical protein n=1 Tax=Burkholderia ambifaria TaxID=152480 RepID=UPI00158DAAED|nr:hypothetical protein [Burkholderia ambifaria]MBR8344690.1 hypothetical protein [Burkholderia ambifaria]
MDELKDLTAWLVSERGNWTQIAERAGVCTRSIHRIVHSPDHNVTRRIIRKLDAERQRMERVRQFDASQRRATRS